MRGVRAGALGGLPGFGLCLAAAAAAVVTSSQSADARYHRWHGRYARHAVQHHGRAHVEAYSPPTASIVVDGNTGAVLHASNADGSRHPASLTKIMTLYLLFERLEAGKIRLDSPLKVSAHAAEQSPTKLGLKPGQTLAVEDAIKAVVTKSANDAAVAIAENLGGDEETFAQQMTAKAHALGMSGTTYVNASGLPEDEQITTARDQSVLGRAIQERFPRYYKYFSTEQFVYHGHAMHNHNRLLGVVGGVDGIKTGYTRSSGFNLVTSVHRDGRYLVAVVLGGRSGPERDARMRDLISSNIKQASLRHTAPAIVEKAEPQAEGKPAVARATLSPAPLVSHADPTPTSAVPVKSGGGDGATGSEPMQPVLVRTVTYRTAPLQTAALAPMPALVAAPTAAAPASPPVTPPRAQQPAAAAAPVAAPISTAASPAAPSEPAMTVPAPAPVASVPAANVAKVERVEPEPAPAEEPDEAPVQPAVHATAHGGWIIQIGAFEGENEAKQHLSAAQLKIPTTLAAAEAFTERVQKGERSLYRARFGGLERAKAEAACKQLHRSDIDCMIVKN